MGLQKSQSERGKCTQVGGRRGEGVGRAGTSSQRKGTVDGALEKRPVTAAHGKGLRHGRWGGWGSRLAGPDVSRSEAQSRFCR